MSSQQTQNVRTTGKAKVVASDLEKPDLDDRSYRVIQLPNQLEALIVHDPDTDKASAALDVHVGAFSDGEDLQGQAHAVEHLLFMGTEKYPKENEYSKYLSEHSGHSNAYTASTSTNYYFEVGHEHFYGALDRFAQFFIAPLFLAETLDRELKAVDSENKKNLQNDTWRLHQLSKTLSNPKHPYCHFSTGNLQTLKEWPEKRGVNVRDEFIKFHEKYYSANTMKLVVLGREDLDTLEQWVVELFEGVKNKDLPELSFEGQPFTENELMTQIFAKPVMDSRQIDIKFPFIDEEHLYRSHPSRYIGHLIGHEGPGSILAYLKRKGWVQSLSAGASPIAPGSAFFQITMRLTEDGLEHYEEIILTVFHYINLVKDRPVEEWIVKELQETAAVDFKFRQKSPASKFTSRQASTMQKPFPREWLLSGMELIREYDPEMIAKTLSYLRPDNFRVQIVSQKPPRGEFDQVEKWYGTEYRVEKIPEDFKRKLQETAAKGKGAGKLSGELHLPHKNEFIPTNFDVQKKEVKEPQKVPAMIKNTDLVRIWYKKDDTFWVPKANVFATFRNQLVYATPFNAVASRVYCDLVKDALNEYAYDAEIAGLGYNISASSVGLEVEISGYNDKMSVLLEKVITSMKELEVKPDRFKVIKEKVLRSYRNWVFQQPYYQVGELVRYLNSQTMWLNEEALAELECLTVEDVQNFYPKLLRQAHIEALVHGNLYKEDALKYVDLIESILKPRALPPAQYGIRRSLIHHPGKSVVWSRPLKDPKNVNSVIEYTVFLGEQKDRRNRMLLTMFSQINEEPCFDQLRTKEQLGYIVFSGNRYSATTMAYRVIVQSERSAPYLESRIDDFLRGAKQRLIDLTEKDFQAHVKAVIIRKTERMKNLTQESNRMWTHIGTEVYDFEQVDADVEILKQITKNEVLDFYNQFINPDSTTRTKASVQMHAAAKPSKPGASSLADTLSQFLTSAGIVCDTSEVIQALEKVDIENQQSIIGAVTTYLKETKDVAQPMIDSVLEKVMELPKQAVPQKQADQEEEHTPEKFGLVMEDVNDVVAWKASCQVTAGPQPIRPLVEFGEAEAKL